MAKVILLVRVSTVEQEVEAQRTELIELASADGFKHEDMVIIEGVGASAIKLNDLYLQQMDELYKTIEEGDIEAVYAWEISRIGRDEVVLMTFKNFLIQHKVQLVVKNPSLRLLNNDGSVNNGIELAFSLFATMSKQEMVIKKERFARRKIKMKAEGKFTGGKIKFGYALNSDKYFEVDPIKADVVVEVFNRYVNGASQYELVEDMISRGFLKKNYNRITTSKTIGYWLRDASYIGENNYPRIIDDETFSKAQERLKMRHKEHHSKHILFAKGLVKDKNTNATLVAQVPSLTYGCYYTDKFRSVNLNVMEYIAEYATNLLLAERNADEMERNMVAYHQKMADNEKLIKVHSDAIERIEKVIERSIEMNINQPKYYPKEKLDAKIKQCERDIKREKTAIEDLNIENANMRSYLDGNATFINTINGLSEERKTQIIHETIKTIWVDGLDNTHREVYVEVENKIGVIKNLRFIYRRHGNELLLWQVWSWDEKTPLELTQGLKSHSRFTRKRYNKQ